MAEVIDFPGPQVTVWTCICGGTSFRLHWDGSVECDNDDCGIFSSNMRCFDASDPNWTGSGGEAG